MACAQNGQSKAQKSMSTTLPRNCSSFKRVELIHVSTALISGAFCPTNASSGCCAQTVVATNNTRKIDLRSIAVSVYEEWLNILSQVQRLVDVLQQVRAWKTSNEPERLFACSWFVV